LPIFNKKGKIMLVAKIQVDNHHHIYTTFDDLNFDFTEQNIAIAKVTRGFFTIGEGDDQPIEKQIFEGTHLHIIDVFEEGEFI
jgi:hypothetical protein